MYIESHLLIGLGDASKEILDACREYDPMPGVVEFVHIGLYEDEWVDEQEVINRIESKYKELEAAYERGGLSVHIFAGLPDTKDAHHITWLIQLIRRTLPKFRLLVYVLLLNSMNRAALANVEAARHAFSQPRCWGHDNFALFLYAEQNEYGYTISRSVLARMVADAVYFRIHNQRMPGFHFYAGEQFFNSGSSMQDNTANSLGMVRIVYPEKQLCEHIVCTLLEQNIQALLHDADKTTPKDYREFVKDSYQLAYWKLSEECLTLDRLDDEESIRSCFWNYIHIIPYEEVKTKEPNPLQYINSLYEETYRERFRNVGIERYYEENWASRRNRASDIIQNVRKDLLKRWQAGELSLWNMQEAVNILRNYLVELRICIRQERIPHLEKEIKALEAERLSLLDEYMSLGILARVVFHKDEILYNQYRNLLSQLYESKTRLKAYWFAGELLEWIINYVDYSLRDIRMWTDDLKTVQAEALRRIDNLEEAFGQTDGLVIGIFDRERLQAFENSLMQDASFMESIRHKLSDYLSGSKEETPKPTEIVQAAYELFMGEIKMFDDRNGGDERFFDLRLLRQLSRQSQNDPNSIRAFVQSIKKRAGAYIRLNPDETDRLRQNNAEAGTFTGVLVCLPTHYDGEKQQEYIKQFKQACEEQFPNIIWTKGKCDEITIIKCLSGFSMRCIE